MSKKIFLIADFFYRDFTGGAELNDFSLVERFTHRGYEIVEVYCKDVTIKFLQDHINEKFIVGNFVSQSRSGGDEIFVRYGVSFH